MSVYKEGYHIIKELIQRSKLIWDGDDYYYGVLTNKGDIVWYLVKQLVTLYGLPETRKQTNYGLKNELRHLEVIVELMDEWNTGNIEPFKITFTSVQKNNVGGVKWDGRIGIKKLPVREPECLKCTCKVGHPYQSIMCPIHGHED